MIGLADQILENPDFVRDLLAPDNRDKRMFRVSQCSTHDGDFALHQ